LILNASAIDSGKRLDVFLQEQLSQYSRSRLQDWIKAGLVRVNGTGERASYRVRSGETIEVEPAELPPLHAFAEDLPLKVLYEDADVIAVDKPAGMVVHAGAGRHSGTLVNALLHHFGTLSKAGGDERPGIVHRLDRLTSGVILVARTDAAHRSLAAQFSSRRVEKVYLALVHGAVKLDQGRIERPISRDPVRRVRMTARRAEGRPAITEYRVLKRFPGFTYLEVQIKTGRTHQIRVHFSAMGHPVVGDPLYGAPEKEASSLGRYFLHAHRVRFEQPTTGAPITIVSPLPAALESWMNELDTAPGTASQDRASNHP
jgi:23S rRNA pseudouridine1911/1915/1917 synthase